MNRMHSQLRGSLLGPPKMTSRQLVGRAERRRRRKGTTGDSRLEKNLQELEGRASGLGAGSRAGPRRVPRLRAPRLP